MSSASEMRLYDTDNNRLYINLEERERLVKAAERADRKVRTLCLTLIYTGCRLSEVLELTAASVQLDNGLVSVRTLKKRKKHSIREIPIPPVLIDALDLVHGIREIQRNNTKAKETHLWSYGGKPVVRTTAYRWIKQLMVDAGIQGAHASPKGLRHGYGIHATRSGVQLHMLQKWMGHSDMKTTSIYATALGKDEQDIASRMW